MNPSIAVLAVLLALGGCLGTDLVAEMPTNLGPERIEVTPNELALELGQSARFEAAVILSDGSFDASATFEWSSSDPSVGTIQDGGSVSAVGLGQAVIRARARGIDSNPATLTVVQDPTSLARVVVSPDSVSLTEGGTEQLTVSLFNLNGEVLPGGTAAFTVGDPIVASVSALGVLRGLAPGETTVVATVEGISSLPTVVRVLGRAFTGQFQARTGTNYRVQGTAVLQEDTSGSATLRFEDNFSTSNGPGLHVYLSTVDGVNSTSIDLGDLERTAGAQSYHVGEVDLSRYRFVIIHCVPFNVTFGSAVLR